MRKRDTVVEFRGQPHPLWAVVETLKGEGWKLAVGIKGGNILYRLIEGDPPAIQVIHAGHLGEKEYDLPQPYHDNLTPGSIREHALDIANDPDIEWQNKLLP